MHKFNYVNEIQKNVQNYDQALVQNIFNSIFIQVLYN